MRTINRVEVVLGKDSYSIIIGSHLLSRAELWSDSINEDGVLIVTNTTVAPHYLDALQSTLSSLKIPYANCILPDGEQYKTTETWQQIIDALLAMPANRKSTVVALGGGVIGDMAGFAAACYMRGIRVIQVPTTLLAQVDASVGGKTGVNLPAGKNLLGAFHQPALVIADIDTLATLGEREYRAGIAEVIKYGLIMDEQLFVWLEANVGAILSRDIHAIQHMVTRSIQHKAAVVSADAQERGQRALLNFGHTFGHALETLTQYEHWLHGEAVAIGMLMACAFGEQSERTKPGTTAKLKVLLQQMQFDLAVPSTLSVELMVGAMQIDKKASSGGMDLILLDQIGSAYISSGHQSQVLIQQFPAGFLG